MGITDILSLLGGLALFLFGIQMACQMTFTSMGNAAASVTVAVVRKFVLLIPLIYIMPALYTADRATAVFMAEPIADTVAVIFTAVLFFFQFRRFLNKLCGEKCGEQSAKNSNQVKNG